jgi:endonuclease YncB( thermonuclease family)
MGCRGGVLAAALAGVSAAGFAAVACWCAAAQQRPATAVPCGGDEIARGGLGRVIDGRTFVLDDGREVRLAAIEVPPLKSGAASRGAAAAAAGAAARDALAALLAGAQAVLRRAEFTSDRYGRIVAYAFARRDGVERSAQAELISAGFARVGDRVGSRDCAAELSRRENTARTAKLGLWANSYYDTLQADNPADVLAHQGRFALVEGKVVSVHESGATIYVNFGRRWSEDFTVTIRKRNERNFAAAGLDLKSLAGRRVRIRGWIERHGGNGGNGGSPWIEAARPEQIEPADLR